MKNDISYRILKSKVTSSKIYIYKLYLKINLKVQTSYNIKQIGKSI